ncbi:MAG TPA: hypothetical protein VHN74_00200 [Candidatus Angelobacter sp.]|jgi:hypothetical protein|nr:hypothetical protein [Candidatus Angelobacter sp.]
MPKFSAGRRRFALGAAAAATAALIAPAEALVHKGHPPTPSPQAGGAEKTLEQRAQEAMSKLKPQAQAEVEAKFANIVRKYGSRLNDEQRLDIRRSLAETQDGLEKLRAFVLENGDEPATVYRNFRGEK